MLDLVKSLPPQSRVLDLGARTGSFQTSRNDLCIVRLDLEVPEARRSGHYVAGDAARLPFGSQSFDLVISNHSLEHFVQLEATIREIGRVIKPDGILYVAVPDVGSLTDRIYRWMARGGGHVNGFRSPEEVVRLVEAMTCLKQRATWTLFSSLSFLNRHNFVHRPPRKIALFAFGSEHFLAVLLWLLRWWDLRRASRVSQYGWAFYFGNITLTKKPDVWINVCVRCGSGHAQAFLKRQEIVPRFPRMFQPYRCPNCGGWNLFTEDAVFQ